MNTRKYTADQTITIIRSLSTDGRAPSAHRLPIYHLAKKHFGTWEAACRVAGVAPRVSKVRGRRQGTERTRMLAAVLHLAHQQGKVDFMKCANYVRGI